MSHKFITSIFSLLVIFALSACGTIKQESVEPEPEPTPVVEPEPEPEPEPTPVVEPEPAKFQQISAGYLHTCALTAAGQAYCWGGNSNGELGDGTTADKNIPTEVLTDLRFSQISSNGESNHICALTSSGQAYCWGLNSRGQLGDGTSVNKNTPTPVVNGHLFAKIAAAKDSVCALTQSNQVYCWGLHYQSRPVAVSASSNLRFQDIAVGDAHKCALTLAGQAYCWTRATAPTPTAGSLRFENIYAGGDTTCATTAAGVTHCWGRYDSLNPPVVQGGQNFNKIAVGDRHQCGLTAAGQAYCWGGNSNGELGDGTSSEKSIPTAVVGGHSFSHIAAGSSHTCALSAAGAYCWGQNNRGQLGDGTNGSSSDPDSANQTIPTEVIDSTEVNDDEN